MAAGDQFVPVYTHGGTFIKFDIRGNDFEVPSKYEPPIKPIGQGASGIVCSLLNAETNERVAVKKITSAFDNLMATRTLREIKILRHLNHENIVSLRDVLPPPVRAEFRDVYIATELMDTDMEKIIRSGQYLSENHFQYFLYQILRGLKYIHSANVIHRDLKPSNLLLNANADLKICDFGLARQLSEHEMTMYVVTRWYRAPELLFYSPVYTAAIDVWSVGCITVELMIGRPLFPGSNRDDQIRQLAELLGTPTESDIEALNLSEGARRYLSRQQPQPQRPLAQAFPHIPPLAIDLVESMLTYDPTRRITVAQALEHPYLADLHNKADEPTCSEPFSFNLEQEVLEDDEQIKELIYQEALIFNPDNMFASVPLN